MSLALHYLFSEQKPGKSVLKPPSSHEEDNGLDWNQKSILPSFFKKFEQHEQHSAPTPGWGNGRVVVPDEDSQEGDP